MHKTWFITGAASRLACDIAKAALAQGDRVFATDGDDGALAAAFAPIAGSARALLASPDFEALLALSADFAADFESATAFAHAWAHPAADRLQLRPLDVADGRAVAAAMDDALVRFGSLDVVVHGEPLRQIGDASGRWPGTPLVRGVFNVTRAALPSLRARGGGRVHHLAPAARAGRETPLFSIAGFCDAVAADVAADGITIDAVAPADAHVRLFAPWSQGENHLLEEA